ncbi:MAG: hypothetical protein KTR35_07995 [Gammaproteobacteria bacterium]|nr:hypothetical protein [Gammaproteobacteria bacterium]
MTKRHQQILWLSFAVLVIYLCLVVYFHEFIIDWVSHNLWVVAVPFAKQIFQALFGFKILLFLKSLSVLLWHLFKLLILKFLKTLGLRYGVFFTQYRWYWIRRSKIMFIRRGKQFFRGMRAFWAVYQRDQKVVILVAFFPVVMLLFLLGLSFNVTRKTMVEKTQETAIFKVAKTAGNKSTGIRAWVTRLDQKTLQKIQLLSGRAQQLASERTDKVKQKFNQKES